MAGFGVDSAAFAVAIAAAPTAPGAFLSAEWAIVGDVLV
jgi:hypothetical protein